MQRDILTFQRPVLLHTNTSRKTPVEISFVYLGYKESYYI